MASRSARSRRPSEIEDLVEDENAVTAFLGRNRALLGGLTAFAVAFSYVAANAIWYQPHAHEGAFFNTRPDTAAMAQGTGEGTETIIRLEPSNGETATADSVPMPQTVDEVPSASQVTQAAPPQVQASGTVPSPAASTDAIVEDVQRILKGLDLYAGEVDGLTGPQTRAAITDYQRKVGLEPTGSIDQALLDQMGATASLGNDAPAMPAGPAPAVPQTAPAPRPAPDARVQAARPETDSIETASAVPSDPRVMRIQAGLRAFGNDGIEVDGVVGGRTRSAILEFQSLFGLPQTGVPDDALYAKMREIGLTE